MTRRKQGLKYLLICNNMGLNLSVLGSSSSGNCYVLQNDNEALILEAGFTIDNVKRVLDFNTSKVSGVLISHAHGDHSKYASSFEKVFNVYAGAEVIAKSKLKRANLITPNQVFKVGRFSIIAFHAVHDVECFGFVIKHPEAGRILFLTDSATCDYRFANLNHILIEANYADEIIAKSVEMGLHPVVAQRTRGTHMELQTTIEVLKNQDLSKVYNVMLLHLSRDNSVPVEFQNRVSKAIGMPVYIASEGVSIDLSNKPY